MNKAKIQKGGEDEPTFTCSPPKGKRKKGKGGEALERNHGQKKREEWNKSKERE